MAIINFFNSAEFKWVLGFEPGKTQVDSSRTEEYAQAINKVASQVLEAAPNLTSVEDQKVVKAFIEKLSAVNSQFKESLFAQSVENLMLTSAVYDSHLALSVSALLKSEQWIALLKGDKRHLDSFLNQLNSILNNTQLSKNDLAVIKKVTQKCFEASNGLSDPIIEKSLQTAIGSVKTHIFIQSLCYQNMLKYKSGNLKGHNPDTVAKELENFAHQLANYANDPLIGANDLLKINANMKVVAQDFSGQSTVFAPVLKAMEKAVNLKREALFDRFQKGLKELRLDSPNLGSEITKLKSLLKEIYPPDHPELLNLTDHLNALKSQRMFAPSKVEMQLVMLMKTKRQKLKNAKYAPFIPESVSLGQAKLLKLMQENCSSPGQLNAAIKSQVRNILRDVIQHRFGKLFDACDVKYTHLVERFPLVVESFEAFSTEVVKAISEKWQKIETLLNQKTKGRFSEIAKKIYVVAFDQEAYSFFSGEVLDCAFSKINSSALDTDESFNNILARALKEATSQIPVLFEKNYALYFKLPHDWIVRNIDRIELAYDQGLDVNKNMGRGTCLQNSFNRISKLLANPKVAAKELPVGSTETERFENGKLNLIEKFFHQAGDHSLQFEGMKVYGLKETQRKTLTSEEKGPSSLMVQEMCDWAMKNGETQLLIYFASPSHAFNVQIDPQKGIYRFFDDNFLRSTNFASLDLFRTEFTSYLQTFYPNATSFEIRTYTL